MTSGNSGATSLIARASRFPKPFDRKRVDNLLADLKARADDPLAMATRGTASFETVNAAISALAGNSSFLSRLILRFPQEFVDTLQQSPEDRCSALLSELEASLSPDCSRAEFMTNLRRTKTKSALTIAAADILGVWDLEEVTSRLTQLADFTLNLSLRFLLFEARAKGRAAFDNEDAPETDCGLTLIAMGKYGAFELNYSSDIDFTAFFEGEKVLSYIDSDEPHQFCISLTRDLVKLMQENTADGYVFRTDLRLRPDAGATAVALSTTAAEHYYESMGQNWERAAMIKARPAAGDIGVGSALLETLKPFVWRKYLDFAAIEDIHSIKRQIHSFRGHQELVVAGHNLKLGLGGIREIEFFTQTQQLILGGRNAQLRERSTCRALRLLAANDLVAPDVVSELIDSYEFFRLVEHRLQMVEDQQTHSLPDDPEGLTHIAYFSGYETRSSFEEDVRRHLTRVHKHYAALFEKEDPLATATGSLVFTGVEEDPATVETLRNLNFQRPEDVSSIIRSWHFGRIPAVRSERARELLTKLVPVILEAISKTPEPDRTFIRFSEFLSGLPAGVQLFSLFFSHPELLLVLVDTLGMAPRLAPYLAKNAGVFDALLEPDFLGTQPDQTEFAAELETRLRNVPVYEAKLDVARQWFKDEMFRIGLQLLSGRMGAVASANAYTDLAGASIGEMARIAEEDIVQQHGSIPGGEYVVIGMGKLGGCELSATSDVDIMVVYDHEGEFAASEGPKPLHGAQYFTRFTQRMITALSAPTAEGAMYEVDMQLRPSGKAGPIAVNYASFRRYYDSEAWDWEIMALTRARVICGSPNLGLRVKKIIEGTLIKRRDPEVFAKSVSEMRTKMATEKRSDNPWELKHVRGGFVDLEFIVQFLQLTHAKDHSEILQTNTRASLEQIKDKCAVNAEMVNTLIAASDLFTALNQYSKLCFEGDFLPETAGESLCNFLVERLDANDIGELEERLTTTQQDVFELFQRQICDVAKSSV